MCELSQVWMATAGDGLAFLKQARTTKQKQITLQKKAARQHPTTKQAQMAMKSVDLDALVTFIKVWGSDSTG